MMPRIFLTYWGGGGGGGISQVSEMPVKVVIGIEEKFEAVVDFRKPADQTATTLQ